MPKDISERIIDSPFAPVTRVGSVSIGGGGGGGGGGATNLDALTDVTLSGVANGQTLSYNSATGQWVNAAPAAMTAHALSGSFHTGLLDWSKVDTAGSNLTDITTRLHSDLQGIGPNDHHDQQHLLATGTALGADHTISGAAAGEVLRALSATTAAFDVLQHTDLGNILPDQHHTRAHDIITGDLSGPVHTVVGADYTVVGVHPANTLAILPTSPAPGAAISVLRTDANGGIQLDTNLLYVDGANNWIGVNRTPSGATLDLIASANADHTQRIKMKSGQTARLWRIEDLSGNELIVLDSVGNLQSGRPGFVSGLTGWQITPQGNAEFNNIWARGELHATVFVKDEIHATGGTFMVATAGTLHDDAVISSSTIDDDTLVVYSTPAGMGVPLQVVTTSGTFTGNELHVSWIGNFINVNDPPSGPGFYFQPGDIVRSKTEVPTGVTDFWFEVLSATQNSGYATYSVYKRSGTDGTLPKGSALVSYGKQGDGRILMTSDLNYAPYIDVFTVGPNVWTGAAGSVIPRMRMGRLDGIGLPGVSGVEQYGMIAGKDLSDANSGYLIASNLQFSLYKVDIRLNNGVSDTGLWTAEGNLKIGKNVGAAATTSFEVITQGANAGDVYIGDRTGTINPTNPAYLYWNQQAGTLYIRGDLVIGSGGGTGYVTVVDAKAWDAQVASDAATGASNAQTNSIAYGDARRIVGVTGTWPSAANQISWSGLAVTFANGSSRSIANGNTGTMAARTYLYVNMSGSGAMTMVATTSASSIGASVNNVLIAVCDPGPAKASVSVVAGSTYISGSNIFTESIFAGHLAVRTITADRIAATTLTLNEMAPDVTTAISDSGTNAQAYGDARRVTGVAGTWNVVDGMTINWTGVAVKFANGSARNITASTGNYTFAFAGRWFLFVDMSLGTLSMVSSGSPNTSINALGINDVLIAVVDAYANPGKASINIVAGSTYISGGNIVTQSIRATEIAATTLTLGNMAPDVTGAITDAQNYSESRRLMTVGGVWDSTGINQISWSGVVVGFGDGNAAAVNDGSFTNITGRRYIYIDLNATPPYTLAHTNLVGNFGPNHAVLAVADPGTTLISGGSGKATITIVAGSTYISGDNILTGSIVANNIASRTIVADKMTVNRLDGLAAGTVFTGTLEIDNASNIHSAGKTAYNNTTPGIFLGWDTTATATYRFGIGDSTNYLQWNGSNLVLRMAQGIDILSTSSNLMRVTNAANTDIARIFWGVGGFQFDQDVLVPALRLTNPGGVILNLNGSDIPNSIFASGPMVVNGTLTAYSTVIASGGRVRMTIASSTPTSSGGSPSGVIGDLMWGGGTGPAGSEYLYLYTSSGWKRVLLSTF